MSDNLYLEQMKQWKMCVLIPVYNHGATIAQVVDQMLTYCADIIVVNDGSTDNTAEQLLGFADRIEIIELPRNRGKGEALRIGFNHAISRGFDRCMTIDADGQHYPDDVPNFLSALQAHPEGLLMGTRTLKHENVPGASSFGNKFANFWYWVITGRKLKDTQSGFRVYPLMTMKHMTFYSHRYEYETEILIRLSWRDMDIVPVPIKVYYPPGDERITHFRKVPDFMRITVLNIILLLMALFYWHPVIILRNLRKIKFKELWDEHIISSTHSNGRITAALMIGVFFGVAPIWGFQMLAIVFVCFLFNLNKPLALLIAQISLPPFIPFILFLSYKIGGWFIGTFTHRAVHTVSWDQKPSLEDISNGVLQYATGAIMLGIVLAAVTGAVSIVLLSFLRKNPT